MQEKQSDQKVVALPVIRPNAAGIDIGDTMHVVAVPPGRSNEPVRKFGAFTCDLLEIVKWLKLCKIDSVAMESTGVYWIALFALLIQHGFEVYLVNSRHTKNVSGKKTDMEDAAWIQQLHSCGLLTRSFLPDDLTETLRTLVRQRKALIQDSSRCIQRIQKNLEMMNIKVHTVIRDITGKTGKAIVEAMINGEREAKNFLPLVDARIQASEEDIVKSLEGNWRKECLFLIKQCYAQYQQLQEHIRECEKEIETILQQMVAVQNEGVIEPPKDEPQQQQQNCETMTAGKKASNKKRKSKNTPRYDVRQYLQQIHGVDVLEIFGINEISALEILAETGTDLSKWETDTRFVKWLNLCPNNKITGGKLISSRLMSKKPNHASQAFRAAANGLKRTDNWLGDYFRRMRAKGGHKFAIVATGRKLALIYFRMVKNKEAFTPMDINEYREKHKKSKIAFYEKKLAELRKEAT
jgi:transposase